MSLNGVITEIFLRKRLIYPLLYLGFIGMCWQGGSLLWGTALYKILQSNQKAADIFVNNLT